jgi:hypothetical protein
MLVEHHIKELIHFTEVSKEKFEALTKFSKEYDDLLYVNYCKGCIDAFSIMKEKLNELI